VRDQLLEILSQKEGYNLKLNTMREYLQAFILRILFKKNFFRHAAFLGGTCLRFLYDIKRFSEDLDFSLQEAGGFDFDKTVNSLVSELEGAGYSVREKIKKNGIYSGHIKFAGLLYDAGMSHGAQENLSIKIDLDRKPPAGAKTEPHLVNKYFMVGLKSFDLSTLLAGKINAVLTRNYNKGRDFYDIMWYLTTHRTLEPNKEFLRNALLQFIDEEGWIEESVGNWKLRLAEKVASVDWKAIRSEVELLIEDRVELELFTRENLLLLLNK